MGGANGGYFIGQQQQPQQQKNQSNIPMGMHLHNPHPQHQHQHHQVPSATVPGQPPPPPRGVGYFPTTNGPPANLMVNSQYPNTFLFNCYPGVANGWAGVPLISTAKRRPPRKSSNGNNAYKSIDVKEFASGSSAMSKLALHAHGAPLILSGGGSGLQGGGGGCGEGANVSAAGIMCGPRHASNMSGRLPMRYRNKSNQNAHRVQQQQHQQLNGGQRVPQSSDTVNRHCDRGFQFLTDENSSIFSNSSGSCSSSTTTADSSSMAAEACLPRIIKPRKRRKKERKPGSNGPGDSREEEIERTEDSQDLSSKTSEEDFEDDEVLVSDFTTSCSCRLCDPHSHIWSFPMGRVCSLESDSFAVDQQSPAAATGQSGISDLYLQTMTRRDGGKDVGVIGGNRQNQQRNEWRGSAQQQQQQFERNPLVLMDDLCDNKLFNGNSESNSLSMDDNNPHRYVNGEVLFGRWPGAVVDQGSNAGANMNTKCVALSDEDSVDSFSCANVFGIGPTPVAGDDLLMLGSNNHNNNFCGMPGAPMAGHDEEEELLIENLANLLNVSNGPEETAKSHRRLMPTQLPVHCETNSDSSGVSSASDCGSVFGECYSPLVNLGSPPSMAFNFSIKAAALPIGNNGLLAEEPTRTIAELLAAGHHREEEELKHQQHLQQQHILNCLDMDWYRAATTNRRLLLPYSNN